MPQGSPLSPLLFNFYINELLDEEKTIAYADDILTFSRSTNIVEATDNLQSKLVTLEKRLML